MSSITIKDKIARPKLHPPIIEPAKQGLIIASCSVLPSRVNNENFQHTVKHLCANDRISHVYIHYPKYCERLEIPYPDVPAWMYESKKIIVNECVDFGPLTKIAPLLDIYPPKSDIGVFLFDDDRLYPQIWINELINAFEHHNRNDVVGRHGTLNKNLPFQYDKFNMQNEEQEFLCLKTTFGVIYPFNAFPESSKIAQTFLEKYKDKAIRRNDDIVLASWCYHAKIPLYAIQTTIAEKKQWDTWNDDAKMDDVSLANIPHHVQDQLELVQKMIANGDFPVPWADIGTVIGAVVFVILMIIFLVIMLRI
jgi:hypothetical protein